MSVETRHLVKLGFFIVLTVVSWSSAFVAIRIALTGYQPGTLALFRYLIASVFMLFLYLSFPAKNKPNLREGFWIFISGVLGFAVYNVALNYGEITVASGIASFIISQIPVMVAFLAAIFLHEKISTPACIGLVISTVGVGLIGISHQSQALHWDLGIAYILVATLVSAIYSVMYKNFAKKFHPLHLTSYAMWSGTFVLLFYLPGLIEEMFTASETATWAVIYLGVIPSFIGYLSWGYMLTYLPATKASGFLYVMPVLTTLMGWLILNEIPQLLALVGGLIALIGGILISRKQRSRSE